MNSLASRDARIAAALKASQSYRRGYTAGMDAQYHWLMEGSLLALIRMWLRRAADKRRARAEGVSLPWERTYTVIQGQP